MGYAEQLGGGRYVFAGYDAPFVKGGNVDFTTLSATSPGKVSMLTK